jgi:GNAT superfamily N-acetyltransferase
VIERAESDRAAEVAERVMRALPRWFGLEEPLLRYVDDSRRLPTLVARAGDVDVGFVTVGQHTPGSPEIIAMGVLPERRREGLGSRLVAAAEAHARAGGAELLQVKTLGPSHPSEPYAETRAFYVSVGFVPLEETTVFWGPANPCLILVKSLASVTPA